MKRLMVIEFPYLCERLCDVIYWSGVSIGEAHKQQDIIDEIIPKLEDDIYLNERFVIYHDKDRNESYFLNHAKDELVDYIYDSIQEENNFKISKGDIGECIDDYGHRGYNNCDVRDIKIGSLNIYEGDFYATLSDEFLNNEEYVSRLINAEDFKGELKRLKKEVLDYLVDIEITEIKSSLDNYDVDSI